MSVSAILFPLFEFRPAKINVEKRLIEFKIVSQLPSNFLNERAKRLVFEKKNHSHLYKRLKLVTIQRYFFRYTLEAPSFLPPRPPPPPPSLFVNAFRDQFRGQITSNIPVQ